MDIMVNKTGRYEDNVKALLNSAICPISKDDISICEENIKVAALKYGNARDSLSKKSIRDLIRRWEIERFNREPWYNVYKDEDKSLEIYYLYNYKKKHLTFLNLALLEVDNSLWARIPMCFNEWMFKLGSSFMTVGIIYSIVQSLKFLFQYNISSRVIGAINQDTRGALQLNEDVIKYVVATMIMLGFLLGIKLTSFLLWGDWDKKQWKASNKLGWTRTLQFSLDSSLDIGMKVMKLMLYFPLYYGGIFFAFLVIGQQHWIYAVLGIILLSYAVLTFIYYVIVFVISPFGVFSILTIIAVSLANSKSWQGILLLFAIVSLLISKDFWMAMPKVEVEPFIQNRTNKAEKITERNVYILKIEASVAVFVLYVFVNMPVVPIISFILGFYSYPSNFSIYNVCLVKINPFLDKGMMFAIFLGVVLFIKQTPVFRDLLSVSRSKLYDVIYKDVAEYEEPVFRETDEISILYSNHVNPIHFIKNIDALPDGTKVFVTDVDKSSEKTQRRKIVVILPDLTIYEKIVSFKFEDTENP